MNFLDFTLGLWNNRCDIFHGTSVVEAKKKKKDKVMVQVEKYYEKRDLIPDVAYMFEEVIIKHLCKSSTQYLFK